MHGLSIRPSVSGLAPDFPAFACLNVNLIDDENTTLGTVKHANKRHYNLAVSHCQFVLVGIGSRTHYRDHALTIADDNGMSPL